MLFDRRPAQDFAVMTSEEVLSERLPVTRVFHFASGGWMYVSGHEDDDSEPLWVHYRHVEELDPTLTTLALRKGRYAMRWQIDTPWFVYGPLSDERVDVLLYDGTIDTQHADLEG
ncbi:hypothetical protein [uncultured Cellulomonas sp.]|uniref:hypothetical protein n=1 Tax=uncultured Cellulomonas sp. TaxID=189682 RepID=UPI002617FCE1|nr:hypothetical protein [uncultured Cellulomonas sp.]